jgi:hypothetical protein
MQPEGRGGNQLDRCTVGDEPRREALRNTAESGSPTYNTGEAVFCARKLRRLCVALREKSAFHGPECPILPVRKCLPECVSILCHLDSRA